MFNKIFGNLAARRGKLDRVMINATHLKGHRTAAGLLKNRDVPRVSVAWTQSSMPYAMAKPNRKAPPPRDTVLYS